jgi:putative flavoprotein involved in K+ transport
VEEHRAIVVGAGPAGLAAAALLRRRGFPVLVLERTEAVGARWRTRYDGLRLNTARSFSTLPGYRISRRYGRYPHRDDFVSYLESYAAHHRLQVRFATTLERVDRAQEDGLWRLQSSSGPLLARHAVIATGYDAVPRLPDWADGHSFAGELIHAGQFRAAEAYRGREVLVIGAGNTGIDVAGFLIDAGARVTVSVRTPPNVFPREVYGIQLQPFAIPAEHLPARIGDVLGFALQRIVNGNLAPYGLPRAPEGFQTTFRRRSVGPAVDDGLIAHLKAGRTRIVAPVQSLGSSEVVLLDGERLRPDAIICATGYGRGLEPIVGHLGVLGPDGIPIHHDGAPEHPGAPRLYFAGFHAAPAGQLRAMPRHARRIARAAARDQRAAGVGASALESPGGDGLDQPGDPAGWTAAEGDHASGCEQE